RVRASKHRARDVLDRDGSTIGLYKDQRIVIALGDDARNIGPVDRSGHVFFQGIVGPILSLTLRRDQERDFVTVDASNGRSLVRGVVNGRFPQSTPRLVSLGLSAPKLRWFTLGDLRDATLGVNPER